MVAYLTPIPTYSHSRREETFFPEQREAGKYGRQVWDHSTVVVTGTGGTKDPSKWTVKWFDFRKHVHEQIAPAHALE